MTDPSRVRIALTLILGLLAFPAAAAAAADDETRIIVRRDPGLSAAERTEIRSDAGVKLAEKLPLSNTEVVTTDADRAKRALRRLNADPDVRYAELDRVVHAFTTPNDTYFDLQWALENTGQAVLSSDPDLSSTPHAGTADADMDVLGADYPANDAWTLGNGGAGHTIGVVDSGVLATHEDLVGHISDGLDWVGQDTTPEDPNGHGTHVSGTIAATANNAQGVAGVAPLSRVLPLRVLDSHGEGRTSDVVAAFALAGRLGLRVLNASLGSDTPSNAERDAIAAAPGTLFVVAAGNDPTTPASYPCSYPAPNILCVGASDQDDKPAGFSYSSTTDVDVFAPGTNIVSAWPFDEAGNAIDDGYAILDGTSMAAPNVAGVAALLLGRDPRLTAAELSQRITANVDVKPLLASKAATSGRVNAAAALGATPAFDACAPTCASDRDGDGVANTPSDDACPDEFGTGADGCIAVTSSSAVPLGDSDTDGKIDYFDDCPSVPGRTSDGCPDSDGDGVKDSADTCPSVPGALANGCPPPPPPPVIPPPPLDRDGDGRADSLDACPVETAATRDGCPVPVARSLAVKIVRWRHEVTLRVRSSRVATAYFAIERRVCNRRGKHCRWKRVASRRTATVANVASFRKRLPRGSYRGSVTLSSSAGKARPTRRSFRVR